MTEILATETPVVRVRILAYLGQLRPGERVAARKLCYDLSLCFSTAKNVLTALEDRGWVTKEISRDKNVIASFAIAENASRLIKKEDGRQVTVPMIPPEWEPAYGRHPYST